VDVRPYNKPPVPCIVQAIVRYKIRNQQLLDKNFCLYYNVLVTPISKNKIANFLAELAVFLFCGCVKNKNLPPIIFCGRIETMRNNAKQKK